MNTIAQPLLYSALMLIAGLGIPVMAALNGGLGSKLQSPVLATVILFAVGLILALTALLLSEGVPTLSFKTQAPIYYYAGGLFVIFYILSITWVSPRFGISNAVAFVLLGQLISMTAIDHYSFFGTLHYPISFKRGVGLILMAIGVLLVVKKS